MRPSSRKYLNILVITPYYKPENFKINDFTSALKAKGHQISVLAPIPNYPKGDFYEGYSLLNKRYEFINDEKIYRVPVIPRKNGNNLRLALNYISFIIFSILPIIKIIKNDYDLIFVYAPSPATVGLPGILLKKLFKIPLIYWVHDLWPESVVFAGNLKSNFIPKILLPVIKFIYKNSDKILVSSPGFIDSIVEKGIKKEKIMYFPQWAENIFKPVQKTDKVFPINFQNKFIVMFAGNIGEAQDFDSILKAVYLIKNNENIKFVILGAGRKEKWVKNKIIEMNIEKNIFMAGNYPLHEMPYYYSLANVMLISLKKSQIFSVTIPSKFQSYLACGKPIVSMSDGIVNEIINKSKVGLTAGSGNYKKLSKNIKKMSRLNKEEIKKMGDNSLSLSIEMFNRDKLISEVENLFFRMIKI